MENTNGNKFNVIKEKYSDKIEEFAKQKAEIHRLWNIDDETAKYLFNFILEKRCKQLIEVGTSNGFSTFWQATACSYNSGELDTIEVDESRYNLSKSNLEGINNITQHFGMAEEVIPNLDKTFDYAFLDAGKIGYIKYIKLLIPKLQDTAIVIADNIISHKKTVQEYLDFINLDQQFENVLIEIGSGLMVSYFKRERIK